VFGIDASIHVGLLAASALVTAGLGTHAWRRREDPGARPFALMMAAATVWSACYAVALTQTGESRLFWERAQWFGIATIPVFFFLFAMEYTGRDRFTTRRAVAALSVIPAVTILLVWTNPAHGLVWRSYELTETNGITVVEQWFGAWYWVNLIFAYGLVMAGSIALLQLVFVSEYLYTDQAALLAVGVAAPLVANGASVTGRIPLPGLDLTPYAFTVTGIAFGNALFRYRLFELLPATRRLGRQAALGALDDGLLIVDTDRQVIYMNQTAGDVLGCDPADALGTPVEKLVDPGTVDFDSGERLAELSRDGRTYEVETAPVTDRRDRVVGHTVLLYDVTERERRERELRAQRDRLQRLERINTVIRDVNQALIDATTVEEAERTVAETLVTPGGYEAAWVSTSISDGPPVGMTADEDGVCPAPEEALPEALDPPDSPGTERPPDVVRPDGGDWATVAIVHGRTVYGVLALRTDYETGFTERELAVLDELGETVGHALNAIERTRLSIADTRVELDLASTDEDGLLVTLAAETGAEWTLEGIVPAEGRKLVLYLATTAETEASRIDDHPGVTDVRRIDSEGETTLEVTATGGTLAHPLIEAGANVRTATADAGRCRLVAEITSDSNLRTVLERTKESFPETELLAKRDIDPTGETALPDDVRMTDRQQEALEAAYRAGYFEWPRESSAEEVAESLDISAATLHGHLRKAEGRLVDTFFGG
jgi:predicted DNA binding protein/PAS domain-containing protein